MYTKYSSVDPDSGARAWPQLGILKKFRKDFKGLPSEPDKPPKAIGTANGQNPPEEIHLAPLPKKPGTETDSIDNISKNEKSGGGNGGGGGNRGGGKKKKKGGHTLRRR
jgi:hypothetical protein